MIKWSGFFLVQWKSLSCRTLQWIMSPRPWFCYVLLLAPRDCEASLLCMKGCLCMCVPKCVSKSEEHDHSRLFPTLSLSLSDCSTFVQCMLDSGWKHQSTTFCCIASFLPGVVAGSDEVRVCSCQAENRLSHPTASQQNCHFLGAKVSFSAQRLEVLAMKPWLQWVPWRRLELRQMLVCGHSAHCRGLLLNRQSSWPGQLDSPFQGQFRNWKAVRSPGFVEEQGTPTSNRF